MPMRPILLRTVALLLLPAVLLAAPSFWTVPNATPTPIPPPDLQPYEEPQVYQTATPTAVIAPALGIPSPTPTPKPGLKAINPTTAAALSLVPGVGHVYAGDPGKGLVFAALFGLGLWQTLDNLQLVHDSSGTVVGAKNETAGNLFGLATLAVYGFGIQDAYNTAQTYNKENYLTLGFGIEPRPNANLAFRF